MNNLNNFDELKENLITTWVGWSLTYRRLNPLSTLFLHQNRGWEELVMLIIWEFFYLQYIFFFFFVLRFSYSTELGVAISNQIKVRSEQIVRNPWNGCIWIVSSTTETNDHSSYRYVPFLCVVLFIVVVWYVRQKVQISLKKGRNCSKVRRNSLVFKSTETKINWISTFPNFKKTKI